MKLLKITKNNEKISNFLYNLRNKDYVRKNSINQKKIKLIEHQYWIKKFFKKKNFIYIILKRRKIVGYLRFEKLRGVYNLSWAILREFQNQGIAKKSIKIATNKRVLKYKSIILKKNLASIKVVENANFKLKYIKDNQYYFYK